MDRGGDEVTENDLMKDVPEVEDYGQVLKCASCGLLHLEGVRVGNVEVNCQFCATLREYIQSREDSAPTPEMRSQFEALLQNDKENAKRFAKKMAEIRKRKGMPRGARKYDGESKKAGRSHWRRLSGNKKEFCQPADNEDDPPARYLTRD